MSNFSIAYQFKALTGHFHGNVKKMKADMAGFTAQMKAQNAGALKLAGGMNKVGRFMSTNLTVPILAAGTAMIVFGGNFEDSMASLEAITGLSGNALDKMRKSIMKTSDDFGISSTNIAKGMEKIGSKQPALLSTPELLMKVTRAAAILAKAAGQELPQASENLLSIMNAFSIGGERANEVINILAASSQLGAAEIPYLTEAMKHAAAGSKFAKLELSEVSAAIEIASEKTGLMASMVGRALGNSMLRLESQINDNFKPSIVGLEKALDNIAAANLGAKDATTLWGLENIKVANELLINRKEIIKLEGKLKGTNVAYEQAAIRMKTFNEEMKRSWQIIKNKFIAVFYLLRPQLLSLAKTIGSIAKTIGVWMKNNPEMVKFLAYTLAIVAAIGPIILILGKVLTSIVAIKTAILFVAGPAGLSVLLPIAAGLGLAFAGWEIGKLIGQIPIVSDALDAWFGYTTGATAEKKRAKKLMSIAEAQKGLVPLLKQAALKQDFSGSLSDILRGAKTVEEIESIKQQLSSGTFNLSATNKLMSIAEAQKGLVPLLKQAALKQDFSGSLSDISRGAKTVEEIESMKQQLSSGTFNLSAAKTQQLSGNIMIETRDPNNVIKRVEPSSSNPNVGINMATATG